MVDTAQLNTLIDRHGLVTDVPIRVYDGKKKLREIADVVYDEETRSLVILLESVQK